MLFKGAIVLLFSISCAGGDEGRSSDQGRGGGPAVESTRSGQKASQKLGTSALTESSLELVSTDCMTLGQHLGDLTAPYVNGVDLTKADISARWIMLCRNADWSPPTRACKRGASSLAELASCDRADPVTIKPVWNGQGEDCQTVAEHAGQVIRWTYSGEPRLLEVISANLDKRVAALAQSCQQAKWPAGVRRCALSTASMDVMSLCFTAL